MSSEKLPKTIERTLDDWWYEPAVKVPKTPTGRNELWRVFYGLPRECEPGPCTNPVEIIRVFGRNTPVTTGAVCNGPKGV